jgi:trigger factor
VRTSFASRVAEEGPTTRWIEVEVPAPRVATAFERAYRGLARSARVRGFRPGKAPRSVLQNSTARRSRRTSERELVGETLAKALEKSGVEAVCQPQVESEPP